MISLLRILISVSHARVIEYSKRPWKTVEEMNEGLIKLWNTRVGKSDRVFVLGDFSFGNRPKIKEIVSQLNGTKILVRGNHDGYRSPFYVEAGFHAVSPLPMLYDGIYLLSHEPVFPLADGLINIHGHIHNSINPYFYAPSHICVSVENTGYRPVTLKRVLTMLKEKNEHQVRLVAEREAQQNEDYDLRGEVVR